MNKLLLLVCMICYSSISLGQIYINGVGGTLPTEYRLAVPLTDTMPDHVLSIQGSPSSLNILKDTISYGLALTDLPDYPVWTSIGPSSIDDNVEFRYDTTYGVVDVYSGRYQAMRIDSVWNTIESVPCPDDSYARRGVSCLVMHYGSVEHRKVLAIRTYIDLEIDLRKYYHFIAEKDFQ